MDSDLGLLLLWSNLLFYASLLESDSPQPRTSHKEDVPMIWLTRDGEKYELTDAEVQALADLSVFTESVIEVNTPDYPVFTISLI